MSPEDRLALFLAKDEPPKRDLMFEARLAMKLSRQRLAASRLARVPMIIAALVIVWAALPGLNAYLAAGASDWPTIAFAAIVCGGSLALVRRQFLR